MGVIHSYELYRQVNGNWNIDSIFDDREQAMYEAKSLAERRERAGIRVIEERLNEETGDNTSRIIFHRKQVRVEEAQKATKQGKPANANTPTAKSGGTSRRQARQPEQTEEREQISKEDEQRAKRRRARKALAQAERAREAKRLKHILLVAVPLSVMVGLLGVVMFMAQFWDSMGSLKL